MKLPLTTKQVDALIRLSRLSFAQAQTKWAQDLITRGFYRFTGDVDGSHYAVLTDKGHTASAALYQLAEMGVV